MATFSNRKLPWLLMVVLAVPICRAASDGSAGSELTRRADQAIHQYGQARKVLSNLGVPTLEASAVTSSERRFNGTGSTAPNETLPQYEPDAVHAALANLNWQSRGKTMEEAARHFHQEGLPVKHLWQSSSSSLSVGINPDRKPGLWFVKRFP
jgi:hypothetical protein